MSEFTNRHRQISLMITKDLPISNATERMNVLNGIAQILADQERASFESCVSFINQHGEQVYAVGTNIKNEWTGPEYGAEANRANIQYAREHWELGRRYQDFAAYLNRQWDEIQKIMDDQFEATNPRSERIEA